MKDNENIREESAATEASPVHEVKKVRHTISAEETFTLAKDVFDLRCLIKSVYSNRAQIARRLNILSLILSVVFTALYAAYMLLTGITKKLTQSWLIAVYVIIAVYVVLTVTLIVFSAVSRRDATTKTIKKNNKILKIFRYSIKIASLAMGVTAISISVSHGAKDAVGLSVDILAIIVSVICIIMSAFPLFCGGLGGLARWLLSPAKIKRKFSFVALEWYDLLSSGREKSAATAKVEKQYIEDIGRCIDDYFIPALGKKNVANIGANAILSALQRVPEQDTEIAEGVLKNLFGYALECGYVNYDPTRDLGLQGSIETEEKPKKEPFKVRLGKKIGSSIVKNILGESDGKKDKKR